MKFLKYHRKHEKNRDIKFVTTEKRRNYLVSEPKHHDTKFFTKKIVGYRNTETFQKYMNNIVHLGLPVLELSKIVIHGFWCNYVKLKYYEKAK